MIFRIPVKITHVLRALLLFAEIRGASTSVPSKTFQYNGTCVQKCPFSKPYNNKGKCVKVCPNFFIKKTCFEQCPYGLVWYHKKCLLQCPPEAKYRYNWECILECPKHTVQSLIKYTVYMLWHMPAWTTQTSSEVRWYMPKWSTIWFQRRMCEILCRLFERF